MTVYIDKLYYTLTAMLFSSAIILGACSPALPKARTSSYPSAKLLKIGSAFTFEYKDTWQGFLSEVIMFEDDIRSDNDDIVNNLTNFYGQPSSTP